MDIATVLGIVSAFGLVIMAIFMGGGIKLFINVPSLMIVIGGTMGATMINYPLKEVLSVFQIVRNAFFKKGMSGKDIIKQFIDFSTKARREGILSLESDIKKVDEDFIKKGVQLSIDGLEPQAIREILETEIMFIQDRHRKGAEIFTTMGTFSPALGMVGTLIGLVQMLQTLSDPNSIGPAMAVALLTTFYGSIMANIVCLPIAGKLRTRSSEELMLKDMIIEGVICLSNGENPRIVEQKLVVFLPPNERKLQTK
ncbi:MAG: MotA/TolQ/ExbB proton channel family protein [Deltaproteobacteria bacterium]|nr:MotA/TolQ/ExbB proton channel family protein [Deltaproteobacteria bacterium]MBW2019109.1 MotA/TolQ/ExbB proton channel family protein [Deltaproteobacteria bacterium]MBW2073176.1 MotA/TolQ/ExbB proton channel family protein [Deltaproteobacteria bacterium]